MSVPFKLSVVGGVRLEVRQLEIAAPLWSHAPHMLRVRDILLDLRYGDLWRAWRGEAFTVRSIRAAEVDANLERLADGRASWQFRTDAIAFSTVDDIRVAGGVLRYHDVPSAIELQANVWRINAAPPAPAGQTPRTDSAPLNGKTSNVLLPNITGQYRDQPVKIDLTSLDTLPWAMGAEQNAPIPLAFTATIGSTNLGFDGTTTDLFHLANLSGRFSLRAPSAGAIGDVIGMTLPTTGAFRSEGVIVRQQDSWRVVLGSAALGGSQLKGAFTYKTGGNVPLLSGQLAGARLSLTDLGPVVGSTATAMAAAPHTQLSKSIKAVGMTLPNRRFDIAALRTMDANILIDIDEVDLNTRLLKTLRPLRAHLRLASGVLSLRDIMTTAGKGHLNGSWRLDGRGLMATWSADLRWDGVQIEEWLGQRRAHGAPPFIAGRLKGSATVNGQGRSAAEILGSLNGRIRTELQKGRASHVAVEAGAFDLAQGMKVVGRGDDSVAVQCGLADLVVEQGLIRPRVLVLDTADSTLWIDGSLSLSTEVIDLRAMVTPKRFRLLALNAPLRLRGTIAHPRISVDKEALGGKLVDSFILGLLNPIGAVIPLVNKGDATVGNHIAAGCAAMIDGGYAELREQSRVH